MNALPSDLRKQLAKTVVQARDVAEHGARKALEALAVHEPEPYHHLTEDQRLLRRALRAQARQLGDEDSVPKKAAYDIAHLKEKVAYDQWHRLLFARFLIENNLLLSPEHGVAVTFHDCEELAPTLGVPDGWAVAARFASVELPEIFRTDDPTGQIELPAEDRKQLLQLVTALPAEVFLADDSLGWVYQFWQAKQKDEVNESGTKIGPDELASVTQLFTEDYMVLFLLHNTLGAWWAGKLAHADPNKFNVATEEEAREAAGLPGVEWTYLRFVRSETPSPLEGEGGGEGSCWTPAAGTFDGWPKTAKELRVLDPCMGSGHFLVAELPILVAMRMAEEGFSREEAAVAVLRDNLYGLELDARCSQIAAFNLALAAWKLAGYQKLPPLNLACSGLAPRTKLETWTKLANGNERLREGMERLYHLFKDGPTLGSLINPRKLSGDLLTAEFHELQPLLQKALDREAASGDEIAHELAVTAKGLAQACEILAGQFTLVATNVPYLARGKQNDALKEYCEARHPQAKADLATCFVERCLDFCVPDGSTALVTPQNWLFLTSYKKLRVNLLKQKSWITLARLGFAAFEIMDWWAFSTCLLILGNRTPGPGEVLRGVDADEEKGPACKSKLVVGNQIKFVPQYMITANPDAVVSLDDIQTSTPLSQFADSLQGLATSDDSRFVREFWEISKPTDPTWKGYQGTPEQDMYSGKSRIVFWESGKGALANSEQARVQGLVAWRSSAIAIKMMRDLPERVPDLVEIDEAAVFVVQCGDRGSDNHHLTLTKGAAS